MTDQVRFLDGQPLFLVDVELRAALDKAPEVGGYANKFRVAQHGQEFYVFGVGVFHALESVGDLGVLSLYGHLLGHPLYVFDSYQRDGRKVAEAMEWYASLPDAQQRAVKCRRDEGRGFVGQVVGAYGLVRARNVG